MKYGETYRSALAIQRLVAKDAVNTDCGLRDRCLLARAFKELEELKLRLRMKPAPRPIDTTKLRSHTRRTSAPTFTEN